MQHLNLQLNGRFNTQPPEGGWREMYQHLADNKQFQHTAARRRLVAEEPDLIAHLWFQHTAARRRLVL